MPRARLQELKESGIDAIVDPTASGLGRYIPRIATVAERIDLKIIVATGLYTFNELPHYWTGRTPRQRPERHRPDGAPVRQGHHRGHRRHRDQGRA